VPVLHAVAQGLLQVLVPIWQELDASSPMPEMQALPVGQSQSVLHQPGGGPDVGIVTGGCVGPVGVCMSGVETSCPEPQSQPAARQTNSALINREGKRMGEDSWGGESGVPFSKVCAMRLLAWACPS
jgi:hypothetical protein